MKSILPPNPWPFSIITAFFAFISGLVVFIAFAIRQNMDLVRPDYYEEELRFQQHLDKVARTRPFARDVSVAYEMAESRIQVRLPREHARQHASGSIQFYRPSDARLDLEIKLNLSADGTQAVDAATLAPGFWRVRLHWKVEGAEFFHDQAICVTRNSGSG
jgi:nitrogen fixation protein FixH